jgi:hypothetical protein
MQINKGVKKQQRPESGFEPETSCISGIPKAGIIPLDHPGYCLGIAVCHYVD